MFGISYVKKIIFGIPAGLFDRMTSHFTGKKICLGRAVINKMKMCEPWTDYLEPDVINRLNVSLSSGNYSDAKSLIHLGAKLPTDSTCIKFLLDVIDLVETGEGEVSRYTPFKDIVFK